MRLIKIVIIFVLLIGRNETVLGQSITPDTCICYTDAQDIRCLECLINQPIKDSIIIELKGVSKIKDTLIYKQEVIIDDQQKQINKLKKQKKRSLWATLGLGILTIIGFLL